ncbi:MAG: dioxygenase, partial [Myxococcota bacterium]
MSTPTRRTVLAGATATAAVAATGVSMGRAEDDRRFPVVYLPHGGGPWPFVEVFGPASAWASLRAYLEQLPAVCPTPPTAILAVSAHWEERVPTVMT